MTFRIPGATAAIAPATREVEAWLGARRVSNDACYFVSLAIEELVTNFIKYGADDAARQHVDFVLTVSDRDLTLEVVDDGHPFDPLHAPEPDFAVPLEQRPKGGLGLYILRQMATATYERRDGRNRLTLVTSR